MRESVKCSTVDPGNYEPSAILLIKTSCCDWRYVTIRSLLDDFQISIITNFCVE